MRHFLPPLIFLVCCCCKEISYKEPQPRGKKSLSEIPDLLVGTYLLEDGANSRDTLYVRSDGYLVASDKKESQLGDSLVLKFYKGYYFVNINENPEWLLRIIKLEENGDLTYMAMDTEEGSFDDLVQRLAGEVEIDSLVVGDEKLYQIDPSPKQLIRLINKGYFMKKLRMKKIP